MGTLDCLGYYGDKMGQCDRCPLAHLCIETAIAIDAHVDYLAERQADIEAMEADEDWRFE